jgi:arylsulfatase A-like enzyme
MSPCRLFLAGVLSLSLSACGETDPSTEQSWTGGAVVYLVDTLRADHLGCYGYERNTSPTIDAFALEGVVFERCMSQSSWTKPATASVLTGLYPAQHGANKEPLPIRDDVTTLAEVVSAAGIPTGAFFTSYWVGERHGFGQGFDAHEYISHEKKGERSQKAIDSALAFIEAKQDEPFFVFVHVTDPHAPYAPPAPYNTRFDHGYAGTVTGGFGLANPDERLADLTESDRQHLIDLYDGAIAYSDELFGRFLDGLRALGRYDDTLILFLADHGEEFGDQGRWRHNPGLFDPVVRIPLIGRFPGLPDELAGSHYDHLSLQIDVMPTVLGALGLETPVGLTGRDLGRELLRPRPKARFGIIEVDSAGAYRKAVVGNGLKYVRSWAPTKGEFLYDFEADPTESKNILEESPERALGHRLLLEEFLKETNQGFFLLVQNGGAETLLAELIVYAEFDHPEAVPLYTESMPALGSLRDGSPLQRDIKQKDGSSRKRTRLLLRVEPGDGDGLRLVPAEGETGFEILVRIDGAIAKSTHVRLGADDRRSESMPFHVAVEQGPELAAPMYAAREELDGDPYRVRFWSGAKLSPPEEIEFTQKEIDALRAIGYMGDGG